MQRCTVVDARGLCYSQVRVRSKSINFGLRNSVWKSVALSSLGQEIIQVAMSTLAGLPVENSVKCLGVWWSSSGSSHKSIVDCISKVLGAFFAHGQLGSFHAQLNPLSFRSLTESCVMPVLMYGSEFWHLNITLLSRLESSKPSWGKESCDCQEVLQIASP